MIKSQLKDKVLTYLLPVLLGALLLLLLETQVIHALFGIKPLQLPLPSKILAAFLENSAALWSNTLVTIAPAVLGLLLGALIGYAIAVFVVAFPKKGYGSLFLLTALNSVPIVALAPIMNRWFADPFFAKLAVIIVLSTGAMSVNAFRGMTNLPPYAMNLMQTYAASKTECFKKLFIPNSLPAVFTALKVGVSSAMIGTIISEFFASQTAGLGYMIKYSLKVGNQKALGWAYIVQSAIVSLVIYAIVCLFERCLLKWHVSQR